MAAIVKYYPFNGKKLVRGDPWTILVPIAINGVYHIDAAWTFRAQVRSRPDNAVVATATITLTTTTIPVAGVDTVVDALQLTFAAMDTALIEDGYGFDLEQTAPVVRTLWVVEKLKVEKDFSRT